MKRILFVDDEQRVLDGLRRMLRPMRTEWEMNFAPGPEAARKELKGGSYDVVVTDMRMPGMNGAQLLDHVRELNPAIARIVLSGQSDQEAALRASGTAHQFLAKPCEPSELRRTVQRACQLRELLADEKLVSIVAGTSALPSLPDIYAALSAELDADETSIKRVGEIIAEDVAMTAKILQLINSAFFGLPRQVENVEEAVTLLGTEVIRGLVLSAAAFEIFDCESNAFQIKTLWDHSALVGSLAASLAGAESRNKATISESRQAGMLHDIGRLILGTRFPEKYQEAVERSLSEKIRLDESERAVIGCDHTNVGGYLLGLWGLPDGVVEAVAYHHQPQSCAGPDFTPLAAVHIANSLVHQLTDEKPVREYDISPEFLESIGCEERINDWIAITNEFLGRASAA